ncbi:hypothetical protein AMECASPLE_030592 [Ameca splendens]|uniref:Uncharacterized protein n=1 Tax=Ameca splendens TaxID=208324 RepID=A0ABV0YIB0_9TELE
MGPFLWLRVPQLKMFFKNGEQYVASKTKNILKPCWWSRKSENGVHSRLQEINLVTIERDEDMGLSGH